MDMQFQIGQSVTFGFDVGGSAPAPVPPPVPSGEVLYGTMDYALASFGTFANYALIGQAENYPPRLEGLTNIYDCRYGLTTDTWINRIPSGGDVTWTGMTIQQDGSALVNCTNDSHGVFESHNIDHRATIYAVFKGPLLGDTDLSRPVIASCGKNDDTYQAGYWLSISVDGYEGNDVIVSDCWGGGVVSSVNCSEYHVVAVRKHDSYVYMWIDGVKLETSYYTNTTPTGAKFGIGCVRKTDGSIMVLPQNSPVQVKFVAVSNHNGYDYHEEERIVENSLWLMQQFGIGGNQNENS